MHPLRVEFTGRKNEFALNLLMCKTVRTKGKICAKVANAESALTPSHRGANGCANLAFTTFVQILLLVCT